MGVFFSNRCDLDLILITPLKIAIILSDVPLKTLKLLFETVFRKRRRKKDIWSGTLCGINLCVYTRWNIKIDYLIHINSCYSSDT